MGLADSLKRETGRAIRSLAHSPGFTLIVIITLALGIGATTAIFTMLDRVVLHALPYADSDRLVWLDSPTPGVKQGSRWGLSVAGYFYFKKNTHTLENAAVVMPLRATITGKRAAERVAAVSVSASIFDVLRLRPMLGRPLVDADNFPNAAPVGLISYNYWKTRLSGDPKVVGSVIMVASRPTQIVGVMGRDATIPDVSSPKVDLWVPATLDPSAQPENSHYLPVVARLNPGATVASAQAEVAQLTRRFPQLFPTAYSDDFMKGTGFTTALVPLRAHHRRSGDATLDTVWSYRIRTRDRMRQCRESLPRTRGSSATRGGDPFSTWGQPYRPGLALLHGDHAARARWWRCSARACRGRVTCNSSTRSGRSASYG